MTVYLSERPPAKCLKLDCAVGQMSETGGVDPALTPLTHSRLEGAASLGASRPAADLAPNSKFSWLDKCPDQSFGYEARGSRLGLFSDISRVSYHQNSVRTKRKARSKRMLPKGRRPA